MLHDLCKKFLKLAEQKTCKFDGCAINVYTGEFCYMHSYKCDLCNKITPISESPTKYNGESKACPSCVSEKLSKCSVCEEKLSRKNIIKIYSNNDVKIYCVDCVPENQNVECPTCIEDVDTGTLHEYKTWNGKKIGCEGCCGACSSCDQWKNKEDGLQPGPDNEYYCEDCFSEVFTYCEECSTTIDRESAIFVEEGRSGHDLCSSCYNSNYSECYKCEKAFPKNNMEEDDDGNEYCENCAPELTKQLPQAYKQLSLPETYQYTDHNRYLDVLKRYLPVSVKDLKKKSPRLATALQDLIVFSGGKDLTEELVAAYEAKFEKENFPAQYTTWRSQLQRSVQSDTPQFVLNIVASEAFLTKLEQIKATDLFEKINFTSKESGHPHVENQLGWARLELDPNKEYILVDEIQTDHMNALDRIKHEEYQGVSYITHIIQRTGMSQDEINHMISEYKKLIKNFPDIAIAAITKFAKENGFKKIYWHEYESGKNLKRNDPPKSLYTEVPKRHFFEPTEERPFGLEGKFFGREARMKVFKKLLG